jgi:hypothetical protein
MRTIEQLTSCADSSSPSSKLSEESDLGLLEIGPDEGPLDWPEPSWTVQLAHAAFVLSSLPSDAFAQRREEMQTEPFLLS